MPTDAREWPLDARRVRSARGRTAAGASDGSRYRRVAPVAVGVRQLSDGARRSRPSHPIDQSNAGRFFENPGRRPESVVRVDSKDASRCPACSRPGHTSQACLLDFAMQSSGAATTLRRRSTRMPWLGIVVPERPIGRHGMDRFLGAKHPLCPRLHGPDSCCAACARSDRRAVSAFPATRRLLGHRHHPMRRCQFNDSLRRMLADPQ